MKKSLFSGVNPDDPPRDISVSILPRVPDESRGTPAGGLHVLLKEDGLLGGSAHEPIGEVRRIWQLYTPKTDV